MTVQAGGTVTSDSQGRIEVRGKKNHTPAGSVFVAGQNGVTLDGRIDARGTPGGAVTVTSSGTVILAAEIRAGGESGAGGTVVLDADGQIDGLRGKVRLNGDGADGGTVLVTAGDWRRCPASLPRPGGRHGGGDRRGISMPKISVRGQTDGGTISLTSTVDNVDSDKLDAKAHFSGGRVDVESAGDVTIDQVELDGGTDGGSLHVNADGDGVFGNSIGDGFDVTGAQGGEIEVEVDGNLTLYGDFEAAGGGCTPSQPAVRSTPNASSIRR